MEDVEGRFLAAIHSLQFSFTSLFSVILVLLLVFSVFFVPVSRIASFRLFASSTARDSEPASLQLQTKRTKKATGRRYHPKDRKRQKAQKKRAAKMASILDTASDDIPVPALVPKPVNVVQDTPDKPESVMIEETEVVEIETVETVAVNAGAQSQLVQPEPVQSVDPEDPEDEPMQPEEYDDHENQSLQSDEHEDQPLQLEEHDDHEDQPEDQPEDESVTPNAQLQTRVAALSQLQALAVAQVQEQHQRWSPFGELMSPGHSLLDSNLDYIPFPALEPFQYTPLRSDGVDETEPVRRVEPWDGQIRWAFEGSSVFHNPWEEIAAYYLRGNVFSGVYISDMFIFQYGLRYIPYTGENVYRTVRIENLPNETSLKEVLAFVPGNIFSAELFDTTAITGYKTVIVVFIQEIHARYLARIAQDGLRIASGLARVTLVNTPTYPISFEMQKWVNRGCTRSLVLENVYASTMKNLTTLLNNSEVASCVECIKIGPLYNHLTVNFYSIESALIACELIQNKCKKARLGKCRLGFLKEMDNELIVEFTAHLE